jgi:hypothetical protein
MTVKQRAEQMAAELGVTIHEFRGDRNRLEGAELEAPDGSHFIANGCHF